MNLDAKYYSWDAVALKGAYRVRRMDDTLLRRGDGPLAGAWPASHSCIVHLESPYKDPRLPDHLLNAERRLLVSKRLKECLEKNAVTDVEYLRIKVIDPTGLLLDDSYFIVHFLNAPACLDLDACGATRSRLMPSKAEKLERLEFKSDPARPLFQPSEFNKLTLISAALAEALAKEGYTGFRFSGLFDYGLKDLPPNPARSPIDALCKRMRGG